MTIALIGALSIGAASGPIAAPARGEPVHVVQAGEVRLRMLSVRAETSFLSTSGPVNNTLSVNVQATVPASFQAMAMRKDVTVTVMEDELSKDLLAAPCAQVSGPRGYTEHPFENTYRVRDPEHREPEARPVFQRTAAFVMLDLPYQPRRISRLAGSVEILRPRAVQTFDFEAPPGDKDSRTLKELVPGLWMAVSRERVSNRWVTTIFCWQCNRVGPDHEGKPERTSHASWEAFPLRRGERPLEREQIGHDPAEPPAIIGIWEVPDGGAEPVLTTFSLPTLQQRLSGIYSTYTYDTSANHPPRPIRVAVATEFDRMVAPFEFRDIPLSRMLPGE